MIHFSLRKRIHTTAGNIDLEMTLQAGQGEFLSLYGASGAGKTTLLRMLAGLVQPDSGFIQAGKNIWFDSREGINLPPQKRGASLVFQNYALFPNMTVRGNLNFAAAKRASPGRVDEILDIFNLGALANRRPHTLSGGQQQRVALARALVSLPELLLLDEPLSALDLETRLRLQNEISVIQKKFNVTTILVSHDIGEVFRLSQRVFCLDKGKITRSGDPANVFLKERLSSKFRVTGVILEKRKCDVVYVLTLLIGSDVVKITSIEEDVVDLQEGDKVLVTAKAFNPMMFKLE